MDCLVFSEQKLVQESGIRPRAKVRLKEQLELVGQNLCTMSPDDLALHLKSSEALEKSSEAVEKVCRTFKTFRVWRDVCYRCMCL